MRFVDRNRIVLIGNSHGGWAIMELLAFDAASRLPFGLAALPDDMLEKPLDGVIGAILLYPYCGPGNRSRRSGWSQSLPVLFLLSGNDTIAPADDCLRIAGVLAERGAPVETLVFDGVTHGFDQQDRALFSSLEFDAKATAEALRIGGAFLGKVDGSAGNP
jgi:dienelactone hydrolase